MPQHPFFVHVPIGLAVLMPALTLGLWASWWRGWLPRRVWWVAVGLQAVLVASSLVALRTGHADAERVEATQGEAAVDRHEDAAERFGWGAAVTLAVALSAALLRSQRGSRIAGAATVAATLGVLWLGYLTGSAGGRLVYGDGSNTGPAAGAGDATTESAEDDD
ncbi:MAG: hypothetical protein IPJ65_37960 [Archangiaceae bacterium]|nr:hypothetical protein [Archangiaceae bacterium]